MHDCPGIAMPADGMWILIPPRRPPRDPLALAEFLSRPELGHPRALAELAGTRARRPEAGDRGWLRRPTRVLEGDDVMARIGALYGPKARASAERIAALSWSPTRRADRDRRAFLAGFLEEQPAGRCCPGCVLDRLLGRSLIGCRDSHEEAVRAWESRDPDFLVDGQPSPLARGLRLAWSLLAPGEVEEPVGLSALDLSYLLALDTDWKQLGPVWRDILSAPRDRWAVQSLLEARLPPKLLRRCLAREEFPTLGRLAETPRQLWRYLKIADRLPAEDWVLSVVEGGGPVLSGIALNLLSSPNKTENLRRLHSLGQVWADASLRAPFEQWSSSWVNDTSLIDRLAALGLDRRQLLELCHDRRILELGETLPAAILAPLSQAAREAREAIYLALREGGGPRYRRLICPVLARRRFEGTLRRTRGRLQRAVAQAREASLDVLLERTALAQLRRYVGRSTRDWKLPPGWFHAFLLLRNSQVSRELFLSFMDDLARGRPRAERPRNAAWLRRARSAGVNVDRWQQGFSGRIGELTFRSEMRPLEILQMGTWFGTCLSLDDGCNSHSTLLNALDVNKQLVVGRRPDGTVAVRKLIGATCTGDLAGYHTYSHGEEVRAALAPLLSAWASSCGLRLSDTATPEDLHDGDWYDDGNEAWFPVKVDCVEAYRRGDWRCLPEDCEWTAPTLFRAVLGGAMPKLARINYPLLRMLTAAGRLDWVSAIPARERAEMGDLLIEALPWRPEVVARVPGVRVGGWSGRPSAALALLGVGGLRRFLRAWAPEGGLPLDEWTDVVRTVWISSGDRPALSRLAFDSALGAELVRRVSACGFCGGARRVPRMVASVMSGDLSSARRFVGNLAGSFRDDRLEQALLSCYDPDAVAVWARVAAPELRVGLALLLDRGMSVSARRELAVRAWELSQPLIAFEWARRVGPSDWSDLRGWAGDEAWLGLECPLARSVLATTCRHAELEGSCRWAPSDRVGGVLREAGVEPPSWLLALAPGPADGDAG